MSAQLNRMLIVTELAPTDNENGTETVSNKVAWLFWQNCGAIMFRFKSRRLLCELYNMFISSSMLPITLKKTPRAFKQVLFSLARDGKVCRVQGGRIKWNYDASWCNPLETSHIWMEESEGPDCKIEDVQRVDATEFYNENEHAIRWLRSYNDIKFFYDLWSSTHDDIMLGGGATPFHTIISSLKDEKICRFTDSRHGCSSSIMWTTNDQFYKKKSSNPRPGHFPSVVCGRGY
jgi:hypothetical protein